MSSHQTWSSLFSDKPSFHPLQYNTNYIDLLYILSFDNCSRIRWLHYLEESIEDKWSGDVECTAAQDTCFVLEIFHFLLCSFYLDPWHSLWPWYILLARSHILLANVWMHRLGAGQWHFSLNLYVPRGYIVICWVYIHKWFGAKWNRDGKVPKYFFVPFSFTFVLFG